MHVAIITHATAREITARVQLAKIKHSFGVLLLVPAGAGVCRDLQSTEAWRRLHCDFQQPAVLQQGMLQACETPPAICSNASRW